MPKKSSDVTQGLLETGRGYFLNVIVEYGELLIIDVSANAEIPRLGLGFWGRHFADARFLFASNGINVAMRHELQSVCRKIHLNPDAGAIVSTSTETAVLGGGCFWCLEAVYQQLKGVQHVESGYTGGHVKNPTYEQVCAGDTGHAEVVKLSFDPALISFREILEVFFTIHDPTTLNRQGNDVGTQYRSVIYYNSPAQYDTAKHIIAEMALVWDAPLVTELSPVETYYKAEDYHQNYFQQHPFQGYCAFVVAPKLAKFREVFAAKSKQE